MIKKSPSNAKEKLSATFFFHSWSSAKFWHYRLDDGNRWEQ